MAPCSFESFRSMSWIDVCMVRHTGAETPLALAENGLSVFVEDVDGDGDADCLVHC